jgi:hypothetical protein
MNAPIKPLSTIDLEFVFSARVFFRDRVYFPDTPSGKRGYVSVKGGDFEGPRIKGKVVPHSGADWALIRRDGVFHLNAHYMLEADDGTPIYIQNLGYVQHEPAGGGPPYFICTPVFDTRPGPHDWLARTVVLGCGERKTDPDHTVFHYWAVRP